MSIRSIIGGIVVGTTALFGSSCSNVGNSTSVEKRAKEYMQDKPRIQYEEAINHYNTPFLNQSKLDSVAYRDVFNTTPAAKDSSAIAEFNKIAKENLASSDIYQNKALARVTSVKEYDNIMTNVNKINVSTRKTYLQYVTDSIAYRKFFEKHNLLDKNTLDLIKNISKRIRP